MEYKSIYSFQVFEKISEGNQVYVLDKQNKSVALVNDMDVQSAVRLTKASDDKKRFDFWICEETEEEKE